MGLRRNQRERAKAWAVVSALASLACVGVARAVRRGRTRHADAEARRTIQRASGSAARNAGDLTGHTGKWYVHLPFALANGARLWRAGRRRGALAVTFASLGAWATAELLDRAFPHRTPPPGRGDPSVQSFPSGHTLEPLAVTLAVEGVLRREGMASPWISVPAGLATLASALGRMALDRHWASDVVGGAFAGVAVASANLAVYEVSR